MMQIFFINRCCTHFIKCSAKSFSSSCCVNSVCKISIIPEAMFCSEGGVICEKIFKQRILYTYFAYLLLALLYDFLYSIVTYDH
ncbi:hypothetical protein OCHUTO_0163 [Orientia chuto str. Dubai]|uniref:Uncharacterized protein n=1 Tax=Orientia chuto str. Dubai TaxID=1359168 RepID=A0A0F3MRE6_9RICK|nr:hypothetical protein OCHUTO_0163 [Orientia chuto str. Dubai]